MAMKMKTPTWKHALCSKRREIPEQDLQELFSKVSSWIADNGSEWLKQYTAAHNEIWESSGTGCCAKARRRKEIMWLAGIEGFQDMDGVVPPYPDTATIARIYTEPGYLSEVHQTASIRGFNLAP